MNDAAEIYNCLICDKPVPRYKPQYCCDGRACGCYGQPIEPCVCSSKCWDALMEGIGVSMEERRIAAGIEKWKSELLSLE